MTLALDTDVLVHLTMGDAPHHQRVRALVDGERGSGIALVPSVLHEWLHVATDARHFARPLAMDAALETARQLWSARDVVRVVAGPRVLPRTLDLMARHGLGRKRILDTALAATLEEAGIRRIATFNGKDYAVFDFLEVVDPTRA